MRRAHGTYDLVLFGLLDSHTQLSDYSNMRIDNFVYTKESFEEAKALLAPDGIYSSNFKWIILGSGSGIGNVDPVFGKPPVTFQAGSVHRRSHLLCHLARRTKVEQTARRGFSRCSNW